jgi:hypothetical protein
MRYFVLLISFFFATNCFAYFDSTKVNIEELYAEFKAYKDSSIIRDFKIKFIKSLVFTNDTTAYFNPNGTLHLFKINFGKEIKIEKISKGIYHGHNFQRYFFAYNSKIYSYGGQGLWSSFVGLIEFNKQNKEWFQKKIKNYPLKAKKVISSWLFGDKLKVLISLDRDFRKIEDDNLIFGEIDLVTFKFNEIGKFSSVISNEMIIGKVNIIQESEKYMVREIRDDSECCCHLFDKENGEIYYLNLIKDIPCLDGNSYVYAKKDTLYYRNSKRITKSVLINEDAIYEKRSIQKIYLENIKRQRTNKLFIYLLVSLISIITTIILVILVIRFRKKHLFDFPISIEKNLIIAKGQILKKDDLDNILEISHMSFDSIKSKRSNLIKIINDNGKVKIERNRDKNDKRFIEYFVK